MGFGGYVFVLEIASGPCLEALFAQASPGTDQFGSDIAMEWMLSCEYFKKLISLLALFKQHLVALLLIRWMYVSSREC